MGVSSYLATDVLCVYMLTQRHQQHEPNVCSHLYGAIAWWHVSKMLWKIDWLTSPWQIKKIAALSYGLSLSMLLLYCLCETDHPLSLSSRNCVQILATWGRALSCCNMRWWSWMNGTTMGLRISSRYHCAFKMPSIKCTCVRCPSHMPDNTITPPPPWATQSTTLTSAKRSPTCHHTCCLPSALYSENQDSSVKRTPLQSARCHRMWAFANLSQLRWRTAVRMRPDEDDKHADELLWDRNSLVMQNRLLQQLSRWLVLDNLGGEDAGSGGLVRLDVLPDSLKRLKRRLMEDKWTFISRATALVDIPAVSMPNRTLPQNLRHLWHCAVW